MRVPVHLYKYIKVMFKAGLELLEGTLDADYLVALPCVDTFDRSCACVRHRL